MKARLYQVSSFISVLSKHFMTTCKITSQVNLDFCPTHVFCNRQARQILEDDGYIIASKLLNLFQNELDLGVCWPDSRWGYIHHFYHPRTGEGLRGLASADVLCERYYRQAIDLWQKGYYKKSMFFLGAVTHLLQDLCQPYHANCCWGLGHHMYEKWVKKHRENYIVPNGGIYKKYSNPVKWLDYSATKSCELFELVNEKANIKYYDQATRYLLPLTQRVTAGFWLNFLQQVGVFPIFRLAKRINEEYYEPQSQVINYFSLNSY